MYVYHNTEAQLWIIVAVESNKYYLSCVCVCVCACMRAHMQISACSLANPACYVYAPYCDVTCGPEETITFFGIIS
jgi:hypothetical protein